MKDIDENRGGMKILKIKNGRKLLKSLKVQRIICKRMGQKRKK